MGIRRQALDLLKSYLANRYQKVKINNDQSNYKEINMGVPQGTILGPVLFILYINDLLNVIPIESILSYADDTAIIDTGKTWVEAQEIMNNYLSSVDK